MLTDGEAEPSDEEVGPSDEEAGPSHHKTPVILHGQLAQHRINDDIADTGTTVLAIETYHDDAGAEGDEVEYGYPITCGDSRAVLLFKKFVCPGINVRCVKFNGQLISPKHFVQLAGKATLKDWKRAIRLGGVMLRKMMDSGQIDFYQHGAVCTNTCRSTKFDTALSGGGGSTRLLPPLPPAGGPGGGSSCASSSLTEPAAEHSGGTAGVQVEKMHHPPEEKTSVAEEWSYRGHPSPTSTSNGHVNRKRTRPPDPTAGTMALWQGVADQGLMGQVLSSLHTELLSALRGVERRAERCALLDADALVLTSLCEMFGLLDAVKRAVERRRGEETTERTTHCYSPREERSSEPRGKKEACRAEALSRPCPEQHRRDPQLTPNRRPADGPGRGARGEAPPRTPYRGGPRGEVD